MRCAYGSSVQVWGRTSWGRGPSSGGARAEGVYVDAPGVLGYVDQLHRYWMMRDRAANARLFRMAGEVLAVIEAGAFHPIVGWQCKECPYRSRCWAWG